MRYPTEVYERFDPFVDEKDPVSTRMRRVRMVTTRDAHVCLSVWRGEVHEIPSGTEARFESALVCGSEWGRWWICVECLDAFLDEFPEFLE